MQRRQDHRRRPETHPARSARAGRCQRWRQQGSIAGLSRPGGEGSHPRGAGENPIQPHCRGQAPRYHLPLHALQNGTAWSELVRPAAGGGARVDSWKLGTSGLLSAAAYVPSPNSDDRPGGANIELLVIHNITLPPGEFGGPGIGDPFTNPPAPRAHPYYRENQGLTVSRHFLTTAER